MFGLPSPAIGSEWTSRVAGWGGEALSLDELFDQWRIRHPQADDARAIRASIRDMEEGETGRPFDQFAEEFRRRNDLRESP